MNNNINLSNVAASSPITNVVAAIAPTGEQSWIKIVGVIAGVLIVAIGYVYVTYKDSPWFAERAQAGWLTMDWFRAEPTFGLSTMGILKETAPAPSVLPADAPPTVSISERTGAIHRQQKPETWCFVGEDLVGRWCVAVPKPDLCPGERSYTSRSECELTPANHMPAGLIQNNGASMLPLAQASIL